MPTPSVLAQPLAALAEHLEETGTAEGFFAEDLLSLARRHLKSFPKISLERELTAYLGCGSHVRSPARRDYRNGYYSTVSSVVAQVDAEVRAFHQRELGDDYVYLFLDGLTVTLKELPSAKKRLVLVAYGITTDGRRVLLDYHLAASESSTEWERFLKKLWDRGLKGAHLQLITTDGGSGLRKALPVVYGEIPHQLCWVHKLRNVAKHLKKSQQQACLAQAQELYRAKSRREVRAAWQRWQARWEPEAPAAVACLAQDLEALCTFLSCPAAHHRLIRTTNYIERLIRELRRRTRPMGAFADKSSADRLFYGVVRRVNKNWSRKTLPEFTH